MEITMITAIQAKAAVKALLYGRTIAYRIEFARLTGSVHAGLFLSQAYYWQGRGQDDWFYKSEKDWEEETGLSRYYQRKAREALVKLGLLEIKLKGVPATLYYRLSLDALIDLLSKGTVAQLDGDPLPNLPGNPSPTISEMTTEMTQLPARQPAQGTGYFAASDEPEYVGIEEEEGSGKKRPKWQVPDNKFQRDFLSVCGAKWFKSKQKTLVKKFAKCLGIGATLSEAACLQRCLDELQGCEDFPERPLAIPNSWLCWRSDHAKSSRWSVWGLINSLFDRDALVRHCQVMLKKMGVAPSAADIPVPEGMVRLLTEDGVRFISEEEAAERLL